MTSISSISNSTNYQVAQAQSAYGSQQRPKDDPMAKVAETLGLSTDELKERLSTGKSLNDLATVGGTAHDDLIAAIKAGMPSSTAITDDVAEKIADQHARSQATPPPPPPGGPRGENAGLADPRKLKQVSDLLDMDSSDVTSAATSASSLVSMLQDKGVDFTQLRNVLNQTGDLLDVSA
ncbi:hypothetical protein Acy02nite_61680 [Actinoplanes cyaneus]|uniref:Uncharacterized protein n=1 Tax=Actinoplanes cyaneus TaxID=52696 RepID=A0A919M710_9ACTN|nr:hypothetical protein [Actinoplanes cyaneus]MCW2141635.1 hypothetical protein [Actinoplanes cyaneus]GID68287.1 hypothetical protein Acy02nite_61680 [Actinoplanes cyaneus]